MDRFISISSVSAVTALSFILALGIELALLGVIFYCMSRRTAESRVQRAGAGERPSR